MKLISNYLLTRIKISIFGGIKEEHRLSIIRNNLASKRGERKLFPLKALKF